MNKRTGCLGQEPEKKNFLWWSWDSYPNHTWELDYITKEWYGRYDWKAEWGCLSCKRSKATYYSDQELMIRFGLSVLPSGGIILPSELEKK